VVPVYNAQDYIYNTLLSVIQQTGVSLEIICVNDGSTDSSGAILQQFEQDDARIVLIQQENQGLSVSRNVGLRAASGRYVVFLDADDLWPKDNLAALVKFADAHHVQLLMFDTDAFIEGTSTTDKELLLAYYQPRSEIREPLIGTAVLAKQLALGQYRQSACLYLINRDWLVHTGLQFTPGFNHEDNAFTFGLLLQADRVALLPLKFYSRRIRDGSITTAQSDVKSVLGYFVAYLDMHELFKMLPITNKQYEQIKKYLDYYLRSLKQKYYHLEPSGRDEVIQQIAIRPGGATLLRKILESDHSNHSLSSLAYELRHFIFRLVNRTPFLAPLLEVYHRVRAFKITR